MSLYGAMCWVGGWGPCACRRFLRGYCGNCVCSDWVHKLQTTNAWCFITTSVCLVDFDVLQRLQFDHRFSIQFFGSADFVGS